MNDSRRELTISHANSPPVTLTKETKARPLPWAPVQGSCCEAGVLPSSPEKQRGPHSFASGLFSFPCLCAWPSHSLHPNFPISPSMKCPLALIKKTLEPSLRNSDLVPFVRTIGNLTTSRALINWWVKLSACLRSHVEGRCKTPGPTPGHAL